MRGDRNGNVASAALWLVFSSSTAVMKGEAGAKVRGGAFLYPGLHMSSCNSPWGRLLPAQRKENSNQLHDAQPVFLSSAEEGSSPFCPMPMRELLFVLETDGCFHVKDGPLRCHGAESEILFSQNGIKFHLNLLQIW